MRAKLRGSRRRWDNAGTVPVPELGKWLAQMVTGYFGYHAVPTNSPALSVFHYHLVILWHRQLCRKRRVEGTLQ